MFPIQFVPDTICSRYNLCRYNLCRYNLCRYKLCRYNLCRYNLYMNPSYRIVYEYKNMPCTFISRTRILFPVSEFKSFICIGTGSVENYQKLFFKSATSIFLKANKEKVSNRKESVEVLVFLFNRMYSR
jgi:hypothetical protein